LEAAIHFPDPPNEKSNHNRIVIYYVRSIAIERQSERPRRFRHCFNFQAVQQKIEDSIRIYRTTQTQLKTAIEMNEKIYRPIDSCINTLSSST
jgi:hypothetical protein